MKKDQTPLAAAIGSWLLGLLILCGISWPLTSPETVSTALIWAGNLWWVAYLFGLLVLIVTAVLKKVPLGMSLIAYIVPVAVMVALAGGYFMIYQNHGFLDDLKGYMAVIVVFFVLSLIWVNFKKPTDQRGAMLRNLAPPTIGGVIVLSMVAFPVFASNEFKYRNAFTFDIEKIEYPTDSMVAKCNLEIHKPGSYFFKEPSFSYLDVMDPNMPVGHVSPKCKIQWGEAGKPADGSTGKFKFQMVWENIRGFQKEELENFQSEILPLFLEVRSTNESGEILYTLSDPELGN